MSCCARCGRRVFNTDRIVALNKVWHAFCFSCYNCNTLLDVCSFRSANCEIFCKCCYKSLFNCSDYSANQLSPCNQCDPCSSVSVPYRSMPRCSGCSRPPNVYCLKPVCPRKPCTPNPCREPVCCVPKTCSPNPCCSGCPPPKTCPVPRETANYYSRNHPRCKCGTCVPECVQERPCKRQCCPCTVLERSPPKSCCAPSKSCCEPEQCDPCCPPEPCCPQEPCSPTELCCPSEPCCASHCNQQRRCIYYPPIKCCEPYPSEIVCVEPCSHDPPKKCCPVSGSCTCCRSRNCCEMISYCQRCYQTVYPVERIPAAGGVYHSCCFTCYCCGAQLDVTKSYEACGEIYCKGCYRRFFGVEGYGVTTT